MEKPDAHFWVLDTVLDMIIYAGLNGLDQSKLALMEIYPALAQEVESKTPTNVTRFPLHRRL